MDDEKTSFISQEKLNVLANRVCRKLDYLRDRIGDNMWDLPIAWCQRVEKSPYQIDSVLLEARKLNSRITANGSILQFHVELCRLYILLYYRHRDDDLYKVTVFPELRSSLGGFNANFKDELERLVTAVLTMDKTIEATMAKQRRVGQIAEAETYTRADMERVASQAIEAAARATALEAENARLSQQLEQQKAAGAAPGTLRVRLADGHKLDMVRLVKAMADLGYFVDAADQVLTPTAAANYLLPLLDYQANWNSILQKSRSGGSIDETFDELKQAFDLSTEALRKAFGDYIDSVIAKRR